MYISQKEMANNEGPKNFHKKFDKAYYHYLLKQHNYYNKSPTEKENFEDSIKMEHSYTRDWQPTKNGEVMATRTILIERPPKCPLCHLLPNFEEKIDVPEISKTTLPKYDEESGLMVMDEVRHIVTHCKNHNADDEDWVEKINKLGWTEQQVTLFNRIERILDLDQMAQLAIKDRTNECLQRHAITEKSVSRIRSALSSIRWEPSLTQWLHSLLVKHLSPSYMASYITILQGLKTKVPTLVDKMLFGRSIDFNQDYLSFIFKQPWEPNIEPKSRKLPPNTTIIVVPSSPVMHTPLGRLQRWYQFLGTMAKVVPIQVNISHSVLQKQSLDSVTDQMVAITRAKIQEVRCEAQNQNIVLIGFNAGAAIALQVAHVETVDSVVCLGFAFNTIKGVRGSQDDRILDLTTPVLFILGQNAQRSSQEEIESLREQMSAQTSLVVIGSADDLLRVDQSNGHLEGATQSMIDDMIVDEIQEFINTCTLNPPGPREPITLNSKTISHSSKAVLSSSSKTNFSPSLKRPKLSNGYDEVPVKKKYRVDGAHHYPITETRKTIKQMSTLHPINKRRDGPQIISYEVIASGDETSRIQTSQSDRLKSLHLNDDKKKNNLVTVPISQPNITQKVKFVPSNQFVHIKPPPVNTQKIYVKTSSNGALPDSYTLGITPLIYNEEGSSKDDSTPKLITVKNKNVPENCAIRNNGSNNILNSETNDSVSSENTQNVIESPLPDSELFGTNILDIPILFADSNGNIEENILLNEIDTSEFSMTASETNNNENQVILNEESESIIEETADIDTSSATVKFLPNNTKTVTTKNNVVILNGSTLNQFRSGESTQKPSIYKVSSTKYTDVIMPTNRNINITKSPVSFSKSLAPRAKVNITNLMTYGRNKSEIQILSPSPSATVTSSSVYQTTASKPSPSFQTISTPKNPKSVVINVNEARKSFKNIIKLQPNDQLKFTKTESYNNNFVIRNGDFQNMSTIKPGMLNRNITVRKINIVKKAPIEVQPVEPIENLDDETDEIEILETAESLLDTAENDLEDSFGSGEL